jgi:hypothetical protein
MFEVHESLDRLTRNQTHQLSLLYLIYKEFRIMSEATVKLTAEVTALSDALTAENAVILAAVAKLGQSEDPEVQAAADAIGVAVGNIQTATATLSAALPAAPAPVEVVPAPVVEPVADTPAAA